MSRSGITGPKFIVLTCLLVFSSSVSAFRISSDVDAGLRYTDNAALTSSDEQDDVVIDSTFSASLVRDSGPLQASADTSLVLNDYTDNTFGNQYYFGLGANAAWEQIEGRLIWVAHNYFTQTAVDTLASDIPDNTQDVNVFSFGPNIGFTISPRQMISLNPVFRDYYYEVSDVDNQEYGLSANWNYRMYANTVIGLNGDVSEVRYDNGNLYPDYTSTGLHFMVSATGARSSYIVNLGATKIDRDTFDEQNGMTGSMDLTYNVTDKSSMRAFLSSDITDSSAEYLNSSIDPGTGDFSNVQTSGDVLRSSTIRLGFVRSGSTLNTDVWVELRDQDYKESPGDRDIQDYGGNASYQISSLITAGLKAGYTKIKETDASRTDKLYSIGSDITYRLSRKLRCNVDIQYRKKDSTEAVSDYNELSVFAGLGYTFGR